MKNTTMNSATMNNTTTVSPQRTVGQLDPKQTVWFQIDDATGFYVTVEEFLAVARSQVAAAA